MFIKSWNQLLYPWVIEVCRLPFEPRHDFFLHLIIVVKLQECGEKPPFHLQSRWSPETHLLPVRSAWKTSAWKLRWEIVWWNAPRIWQDFGSALPFQTLLTQTTPVLPPSNENGSKVKDQGQQQCCHNKHKDFPYRPTRDVSLLSGHASYNCLWGSSMPVLCIGCIVAKGWKYCCIFLERIEEILTNHNSMQTVQLFIKNRDHRQSCWEFMTGTNTYLNRYFMASLNKIMFGEIGLNLKWLQILSGGCLM